ncbi:MAG: hypothetical protein IJE66_02325 [Akkermansia sp.]|nr:hypothetical protein [Akkermansia sp.]
MTALRKSALAAFVLLASCTTMTPLERIENNPAMFRQLSPEHRALVQQGRICDGMSKDAVFLAWGQPSERPMLGQTEGKNFEKWTYTRMRPVVVSRPVFYGSYWGPWGGWYTGGGVDTVYVPEKVADVTFENNCVVSWESRGGTP